MTAKDYRESHLGRGEDYHAIFTDVPQTAELWNMEQRALTTAIRRYFPIDPPTLLDFACGTGRVLHHLSPVVASAVGVDISPSMLDIARRETPDCEFVVGDLTRSDLLPGRKFDLITAFRFFPNAQTELRSQVMSKLAGMLTSRGIIIFNNHLNADSLYQSVLTKTGRTPGHTMSMIEVDSLVHDSGLRVVAERGFMLLPNPPKYFDHAPALFGRIERVLSQLNARPRLAEDVLVVAARA